MHATRRTISPDTSNNTSNMSTRKALQRKHLGRKQEQQELARNLEGFCGELDKMAQKAKEDGARCEAIANSMAQSVAQQEMTAEDFVSLKQHLPALIEEQQRAIDAMGPQSPMGMFMQWNRLILKVVQYEDQRTQQRAAELDAAKKLLQATEAAKTELDEKCQELRETMQRCNICFEEERPLFVMVPCGHTACSECAPRLRECYSCRAKIKMTCKLHL